MKKTLVARLVVGALATIAAGGVMAGQIQASSVSIAREVITADDQAIIAPSIAYRFAGDVDARVQAQTFQVQFTLAAGTWDALPANFGRAISVSDGVSGDIQDQSAVAPFGVNASYQVNTTGLSTDKKTLFATITVNQGAAALIKQPIISLNVTSNTVNCGTVATALNRASVKGLKTVVGDLLADYAENGDCARVKTLPVSFKHYVALTAPAEIATDGTATPDEHTRAAATNSATLMTFPTNLLVEVKPSLGAVKLSSGGSLQFAPKAPGLNTNAYVTGSLALLGTVAMKQNAYGYDADLATQYTLANGGAGVLAPASAAAVNGPVEGKDLKVVVSATNGFVQGGSLFLAQTGDDCGGGAAAAAAATAAGYPTRTAGAAIAGTTVAITAANAAGPITLTVPNASLHAALGATTGTAPVYVCYSAPGTTAIPASQFSAVATLEKAAGAGFEEQYNICKGAYNGLGGGLKIDVRNYASSKETSGYMSVLRFINNSDTVPADIWAQIIHQDGKLGAWGKLTDTDLAPRGVLNMTAKQIEARLTNTATQAVGQNDAMDKGAAGAPRLRITSNKGTTLRVQNYMFNSTSNQIMEVSGAQGVDFEGWNDSDRVPGGNAELQDAPSGLNLQ